MMVRTLNVLKQTDIMVKYELEKIWRHRGFTLFFILMLIANMCVSLYTVYMDDSAIPADVAEEFFVWYCVDTEKFMNAYDRMMQDIAAQEKAVIEHLKLGDFTYEPSSLPVYYAPEGYTDQQLFAVVMNCIASINNYSITAQCIVDTAEQSILQKRMNGIADDAFTNQYQKKVMERYSKTASNVSIDMEYVHGWDEYLSYTAVDLFLFIVISVMSSVVYTMEGHSGFIAIMITCRYGRRSTALAKMLAGLISTVAILILFTLETWSVYLLGYGFSNPSNAIQALPGFSKCPYVLTIGQGVLLGLIIKFCVLYTCFLLLLRISMWIGHYAGSFIACTAVMGVNILIEHLEYINLNAYGKILNVFSAISPSVLFSRYLGMNIAGYAIDAPVFVITLYGTVMMLLSLSILMKSAVFQPKRLKGRLKKISENCNGFIRSEKQKKACWRMYPESILYWELYKLLNSGKLIAVLLLLLIAKSYYTNNIYTKDQSYGDFLYEEYMTVLSGESTTDKRNYIMEERSSIDRIMSDFTEAQEKFLCDEITYEEYRNLLLEYDYAYTHDPVLEKIEKQVEYIDELAQENREAWFIYDTGWSALFMQPFDWNMFAAALVLYSGIFSCEYFHKSSTGGAYQIIKCSSKGRAVTFRAKCLLGISGAVLLFAVWTMIEIAGVSVNYDLPELYAPIQSIQIFRDYFLGINIIQYIILFYITRLSAVIILALTVCFLSSIVKSSLGCMVITVVLTTTPNLLAQLGINALKCVDFIALFRGTPAMLYNEKSIIFMVVCSFLTIFLGYCGFKIWNVNK